MTGARKGATSAVRCVDGAALVAATILRTNPSAEAIPFKETKGYVQGVIRNSAQYRRLYDESGNFKPNVGTRAVRAEIDTKSEEQLAADLPDVVIDGDRGVE